MTDLTSLTLAEARDGLANKSFTSLELTEAHLKAIEQARALNAFVLETPEQARAMARAAEHVVELEHDRIFDASARELPCRGEPGDATADDRDLHAA